MSFFATLLIDGIEGESKVSDHEKEIDVSGWYWGAKQESTGHTGGGGGTGKVNVKDMTIIKKVDRSSPNLFLSCATGKHIPTVTLTLRKAGGQPLDYYTIIMENVVVTSFDNKTDEATQQATAEVMEEVTLKFRTVEIKYQPQNDKGEADGGTIDAKYYVDKNVA